MVPTNGGVNFAEYLTVGEAAEFLGVSTATLRNWDRSGKLTPRRHPHNGYRIYLHEDLQAVLRSASLSIRSDPMSAPQVDWSAMSDTDHFVQFYESDDYLIECVSRFVHAALTEVGASVVIATTNHRIAIQRTLVSLGVDVSRSIEAGRYVVLDAADTLAKFMVDGAPDPQRFVESIGAIIAQLSGGGRRVHAFGEMVSLLWGDGNRHAAIRLEELWNDLAKVHRFALFCAYPIAGFDEESHAVPFNGICACHSRVIPSESYADIDGADERLRAISLLQQKAQTLSAEIEHRKEVEKSLSKRERELADFFASASEGLHKVGPDGTVLWANKADYELLGYSEHEYVGQSICKFHADSDVISDILKKLHRGEALKDFPARLSCKNGHIKHVLISSNACFEDGKFLYTRCFTRDVTPLREAEQALLEADRRKDQFLATLAHELRNPLAPIRHALEVLGMDVRDPEVGAKARRIMERQVQQMTRLVDDLLDVSRITRDKIELRAERIELATVVQTAVETSRPLIDAAGHQLRISLPNRPVLLKADPTRLAQVFSNLLNNSAKYTEAGGQIEMESKVDGKNVIVIVRDNGVGISCESLAYVFDMFRQADRSLEKAQGGLGIGLALVRRLVELHGGTINARSEGVGKGSEFIVRLPVSQDQSQSTNHVPKGPPVAISQQRILVVDDNKDSGDTLSLVLKAKGHEVRTARDGLQAIDIASDFRPRVILMDIGMPKLNGYETTRRIRDMECGKDVMIVALTGWGQAEDIERSKEAGCSAHLVKPVDFAALDRLLASRSPLAV